MDYEQIVHHLGDVGKYQKILVLKAFLPIFFGTFSIFIPNFCLGVHHHRPTVFPESPRWLISKGRLNEAIKIIQKAAKVNKVSLPPGISTLRVSDKESLPFTKILKQLGRSKRLLVYLAIAMSNW
ncbi:hypothetical protein FSP39_023504 [Pinctada imbricata]|uniref:Uncharacterized protein n=1 Tax=Pinctada imbricata TaxID=66713 RepID=A0AA88YCN7_PINIB|nr:hypothetical protein FSP39_023504 [Pinctada imbricata]